ncbi:uncharacterized protein LOC127526856 [Erpetoichthys calabaricus]|uniref:uncharacterized protein LOC127526856 n=1 Tax=Erpetoichthys calabaricus TaxID=27687 RepID=UPI00223463A6|nr:uncharacterized protein LOC127526856 [Erpetoichthys calabaricus]
MSTVHLRCGGQNKGCASKSVCDNPNGIAGFPLYLNQLSCCQGNYCNNPNSIVSCNDCSLQSWPSCPSGSPFCYPFHLTCAAVLQHSFYSSGEVPAHYFFTTCTTLDQCNKTYSYNTGYYGTTQISTCCDSDPCDLGRLEDNSFSSPNGLVCCANNGLSCQTTVNCTGAQDHCFITGDGPYFLMGCASQSVCDGCELLPYQLECCQGDLCNVPYVNSNLTCSSCVSDSWETCQNETVVCSSSGQECASSFMHLICEAFSLICSYYYGVCVCVFCAQTELDVSINEAQDPNGLSCCSGQTRGVCQNSVNCIGSQDHCFISGVWGDCDQWWDDI